MNGREGCFRKHTAQRYRPLSPGSDQGFLQPARHSGQPKVFRPQLHDPEPAGQCPGLCLLRFAGSQRGPCRDGGTDGDGGELLEERVYPCAHFYGRFPAEENRSRRLSVEQRRCLYGSAEGSAVISPSSYPEAVKKFREREMGALGCPGKGQRWRPSPPSSSIFLSFPLPPETVS